MQLLLDLLLLELLRALAQLLRFGSGVAFLEVEGRGLVFGGFGEGVGLLQFLAEPRFTARGAVGFFQRPEHRLACHRCRGGSRCGSGSGRWRPCLDRGDGLGLAFALFRA